MTLWRISNHVDLGGEGGLRASGRWHTRGRLVVYCSESPSAALLEILVHLEVSVIDLPIRYRLLKLHVPDDLTVGEMGPGALPEDWVVRPDLTRGIGDEWISSGRTTLLRVPSALMPETFNVLLNPSHRDAARVVVAGVTEHPIDPRLLA